VAKRFIVAFVAFIGLIFPAAFALALLAAPARPAPLERPGCDHNLADAFANVTTLQERMNSARGGEACARHPALFPRSRESARDHRAVQERVGARAQTRPARCRCRNNQQHDRGALQLNKAIVPQNSHSGFHTFAKVPCDSATNT